MTPSHNAEAIGEALEGVERPDLRELRLGQAVRAYRQGIHQSAKDEEEARRQADARTAP